MPTTTLLLGELSASAGFLGAISTIQCRSSCCKCISASLASDFVVIRGRAWTAAIRLVLAQPGGRRWAVPFLRLTLFASQKLAAAMCAVVILAGHYLQVFGAIIESVSVLVMDILMSLKGSAKHTFHYDSMLIASSILAPYFGRKNDVSMSNVRAVFEAMVFCSNKISSGLTLARVFIEKRHRFTLYVSPCRVVVPSDGCLLTTTTLAVAWFNWLRGLLREVKLELHRNSSFLCQAWDGGNRCQALSIGSYSFNFSINGLELQ